MRNNKGSRIIRQPKVLVIDSLNYTRLGMDYALTNAGYKVSTAHNSQEAMNIIQSELPDAILLSLRSNDADGTNTLKELKEYFRLRLDIASGAEPPIIILSSFRNSRQALDLQYLGASIVLFKPINIQDLPEIIDSVIANKHNSILQEKRKILIFDAEQRSRSFLQSVLAHETYDFEMSESEAETMAKIKNKRFDLIILDLSSFDNDFMEMLKRIKEMVDKVPIITTSAFGGQISKDQFSQLGIFAHFTKPINISELQSTVDRLMEIKAEENITENISPEKISEEEISKVDELIDNIADQVKQNES
ncbi:MAG: response regulator [bacterium]